MGIVLKTSPYGYSSMKVEHLLTHYVKMMYAQ